MNDWCGQTTYVWRCMSIRYVASAIRRSTVPEAAYSQVNVSGCRRSRRPSSVFCGYLTITAAFASILLNIAMSGTALMVIIDVTSPGSDVICTLLRSLWCQADSNCTVPTDHPLTTQLTTQLIAARFTKQYVLCVIARVPVINIAQYVNMYYVK